MPRSQAAPRGRPVDLQARSVQHPARSRPPAARCRMNPTASHQRSFLCSHPPVSRERASRPSWPGPPDRSRADPRSRRAAGRPAPSRAAPARTSSPRPRTSPGCREPAQRGARSRRRPTTPGRGPEPGDQDSNNDVLVLAKALVYAKTKVARYRTSVLTNLRARRRDGGRRSDPRGRARPRPPTSSRRT